jgi:carbon-monoxide dehydrogenase medium subunit
MKTFDYHKPNSVSEAVALMSNEKDSRPIAGGMSLLPTMKQRLAAPEVLIDLSGIVALKGIEAGAGAITVGAMTRHVDVANSPAVANSIPALAQLATVMTNRQEIPAEQFFRGMFETALAPGELITAVRFPLPIAAGYAKMPNAASRFALVGVFVAKFATGVRVAVTGAGPAVFRVPVLESALSASFQSAAVNGHGVDPAGLNSDIHAESAFRAHLIVVMAKRAVAAALAAQAAA